MLFVRAQVDLGSLRLVVNELNLKDAKHR